MVDIAEVQAAAYGIAKIGTSGYDSTPEFIIKANQVNLDLMNLLTPHYGKISAVDDLLGPFVKQVTGTFTSGIWDKPADYYGIISLVKTISGEMKPVQRLKANQIAANSRNSIRKATVESPKFYQKNDDIVLLPSNGDAGISILYLRLPEDVAIFTTNIEDDDDDYVNIYAQNNYEWPARAKNLLVYLLVQRLGVEMKEPILYEVSQLGIQQNLTVNSAQ